MPTNHDATPLIIELLQTPDHGGPCKLPLLIRTKQFAAAAFGADDFRKIHEQSAPIGLKPVLCKGELAFQHSRDIFAGIAYSFQRYALFAEPRNNSDLDQLHIG